MKDIRGNDRFGDWIQTFPTGTQFFPLDARIEDIHLEDIAHHLSLQTRYAGACRFHYSVAHHSYLMMLRLMGEKHLDDVMRQALLHDAAEAYLMDIPRPLKKLPTFARYRFFEEKLMGVIFKRFGLPTKGGDCTHACTCGPEHAPDCLRSIIVADLAPAVKEADIRMLLTEKEVLCCEPPTPWGVVGVPYPPGEVLIIDTPPVTIKYDFLRAAKRLGLA